VVVQARGRRPVPPFCEQQAIAAALGDVGALIASLDRLIAKKRDLKRAAMQQLLTGQTRLPGFSRMRSQTTERPLGGTTEDNREGRGLRSGYKLTEVGLIPDDWQVAQVGDLKPFITSGSRGWAVYYSDRGSLFVRITNLSRDTIYLNLEDTQFVNLPPAASEAARTRLNEHDVLISITADIGIVGYVDSHVPPPAYINQHIALVRFDTSRTSGKFVSYFLASDKSQRLFRATTDLGAKAGMSLLTVQKLQLALPSLPEQQAIAAALGDMDAEIVALENRRDKTRLLRSAPRWPAGAGGRSPHDRTRSSWTQPGTATALRRRRPRPSARAPSDWWACAATGPWWFRCSSRSYRSPPIPGSDKQFRG